MLHILAYMAEYRLYIWLLTWAYIVYILSKYGFFAYICSLYSAIYGCLHGAYMHANMKHTTRYTSEKHNSSEEPLIQFHSIQTETKVVTVTSYIASLINCTCCRRTVRIGSDRLSPCQRNRQSKTNKFYYL